MKIVLRYGTLRAIKTAFFKRKDASLGTEFFISIQALGNIISAGQKKGTSMPTTFIFYVTSLKNVYFDTSHQTFQFFTTTCVYNAFKSRAP